MNGNNLILSMNGSAVACSRSFEIDHTADKEEYASPLSGQYRHYRTGMKEWSVNCSWLVGDVSQLQNILQVGASVTLLITERGNNIDTLLSGSAIITRCKITATRGNLVQGSFSFTGTGELSGSEPEE